MAPENAKLLLCCCGCFVPRRRIEYGTGTEKTACYPLTQLKLHK